MSTHMQPDQTAVQIRGGKQDAVMPGLQLLRRDVQPISGLFGGLNVPLRSPIPIMVPQNPSIIQGKEAFRTTRNFGVICSIVLDHIDTDGKILLFMEPIIANVTLNENVYTCQNEDLGVVSMSPRLEDCINDFKDEILFVWNEYGKEDDNRLTGDARDLKRRILSHIKE